MKTVDGVDFIELETMGPLNTWLAECRDLLDAHWYAAELQSQDIPGGATPLYHNLHLLWIVRYR